MHPEPIEGLSVTLSSFRWLPSLKDVEPSGRWPALGADALAEHGTGARDGVLAGALRRHPAGEKLPAQERGLISCSTWRPSPPARRSQSRASRIARADASISPSLAANRACSLRTEAWSSQRWRAAGSVVDGTGGRGRTERSSVNVTGAGGRVAIMAGEEFAPSG